MSKLGPASGGGVFWHVPGRKRPVAQTTTATSDLVALLVSDGAGSFEAVGQQVRYDPDASELVTIMRQHGVADRALVSDGHGVRFV